MNTTIRNLIVAAPLAFAALTMTPGVASADDMVIVLPPADPHPGPVIALPEPEPTPDPVPVPQGPGDIALPEPGPVGPQGPGDLTNPEPGPGPQGPDDLTAPEPDPTHPDGPDDLTAPEPCPTHGVVCGGEDVPEGEDGGDGGSDGEGEHGAPAPSFDTDSIAVPTRIDAGAGSSDQDGLELSWLLASGALVTVSGAAFAAKRARRTA